MIAAEQKARTTYDNILRMVKDPEVCDPIRFLRKREIIHFQRFGEVLRNVQDHLNSKNFYAFNPSFDIPQGPQCQNQGQTPQMTNSIQQMQNSMQQMTNSSQPAQTAMGQIPDSAQAMQPEMSPYNQTQANSNMTFQNN